jgi:hypothetical protein
MSFFLENHGANLGWRMGEELRSLVKNRQPDRMLTTARGTRVEADCGLAAPGSKAVSRIH